jgi:alkaline phosphatase
MHVLNALSSMNIIRGFSTLSQSECAYVRLYARFSSTKVLSTANVFFSFHSDLENTRSQSISSRKISERRTMKRILLFAFLQIIVLVNCGVLQSPNPDDKQYWHDYNVKYLKKILSTQQPSKVARNVILFVGDGMSFATIAAGRVLKGQLQGKSGEETELNFESFPYVALSKTYNTNSQVPDSAATATAMFSGVKTSIRSLGLNNPTPNAKEGDRLKTFIDWAQEKGKRTGLVTTTR